MVSGVGVGLDVGGTAKTKVVRDLRSKKEVKPKETITAKSDALPAFILNIKLMKILNWGRFQAYYFVL